TTTCNWK
ncbi:unnamed protein product, partial [Allacma fusca]